MKLDVEATSYRLLRLNPCVAVHELRLRMRGPRAFWVLFFCAAVAAGAFLLTLWAEAIEPGSRGVDWYQSGLGRTVLTVIAYTQLVLLLLILPAYSAGAVTMEREKRTLDMLRATLLTPGDVVSGKLLVVLALGFILLLTSLPIAAWSLFLGGVAPEEILYLYTYLAVVGCFAAALGLLFSSLLGRSVGAVVASYGTLLALLLLPLLLTVILFSGSHPSNPGRVPLGHLWGALLLALVALACSWLVFLAARWAWRRLFGDRYPTLSYPLPALAAVALLVFALAPGSLALTAASKLPVGWFVAVDPFVVPAGILEGSQMMTDLVGPGLKGLDLQVLFWGVCIVLGLLAAAFCWALSVRVFRVRR